MSASLYQKKIYTLTSQDWSDAKKAYVHRIRHYGLDVRSSEDLYKRDIGCCRAGFPSFEPRIWARPKNFTYKRFIYYQFTGDIYRAIVSHTDGSFVYAPDTWEVGFRYPSDMTMFLLSYKENRP